MSNCTLCNKFVGSSSVTVVGTSLIINIPAATYDNCERLCLAILQDLPDAATINMPVVITIGADATQYPLVTRKGNAVTASDISFRGFYKLMISTNATSAVFRVLNGLCCTSNNNLLSIPVIVPAAGG